MATHNLPRGLTDLGAVPRSWRLPAHVVTGSFTAYAMYMISGGRSDLKDWVGQTSPSE
ncbi:MAG: hypothetical protein LBO67_00505 [Spirochaetaceae bacterium]|nr:hypothetical protein [Spirochaetaceae bacterium]